MGALDERLGAWAAAWVERVCTRAGPVVALVLAATAAAAVYSLTHLGLNSDEDALFSEELAFVQAREEFKRAFPRFIDPIVVVVDGESSDHAEDAAARLEERIQQEDRPFESVYRPGGGPFFEEHGLLYLDVEDLEALSEDLVAAQPYLAELSRDPSLRGFFSMLAEAAEAVAEGDYTDENLADVLDRVSAAVEGELQGESEPIAWSELLFGTADASEDGPRLSQQRRRFLLVAPRVDFDRVAPAEEAILTLRRIIRDLGLESGSGGPARARLTGVYVLSYEESEHVSQQTTLAGVASFLLVALVLMTGLRSWRLVVASLITLLSGLALTAGFAAVAVGHLNLISVAFAVLFIGLSIDFAIHVCIHYVDFLREGATDAAAALRDSAADVGGSLAICAATTAVGFYAFVPTAYRGVGELGLIAGTGMFVSLFCNLTLLPALVVLMARPHQLRLGPARRAVSRDWLGIPVRHARTVVALTALVTLGAAALVPRWEFDPNPLRMRDPTTESVQAFDDLLEDAMAFPWNLNALVPNLEAARELAERLDALPSVERTVTLADFVPERQEEKLAILEETSFLLGPTLTEEENAPPPTPEEQRAALRELRASLGELAGADVSPELARAAERLREVLERVRAARLEGDGAPTLSRLEQSLLGTLPERLRLLRSALDARTVGLDDIPSEVVDTMRSRDGRMRVEIFPSENLNDNEKLERYVEQVRERTPNLYGDALNVLGSANAVVNALQQALALATSFTFVVLLVLWRSWIDAALVAVPLLLAGLYTAATSVLLGIPLNFANVIVIPLLLGMGVDTGIHLVHRVRQTPLPGQNLLRTGTARAVLLSSLTTVASFGTLGASSHPGMASLGQLLAIGILLILLCNLVVLPALVALRTPRPEGSEGGRD